jgi:hypothetical protein
MPSVKEIAKAAKLKVQSKKKITNEAFDEIKKNLPENCALLLQVLNKSFKINKDFDDLNHELKEITKNLHFNINDTSSKYKKSIKDLWSKEKAELQTDGIIICDIYYKTKNLTTKYGFKQIADKSEGNRQLIADALANQTYYDDVIIRVSANPIQSIDVNNLTNHLINFSEIDIKKLAQLISKTEFNWTLITLAGFTGATPNKKIYKFKNYKKMIENLTNFLVDETSKEKGEILKYFSKGLVSSIFSIANEFLTGFKREEIDFASSILFYDEKGREKKI